LSISDLYDVKVVPPALPLSFRSNSDVGILLIHGFTGSPHDYRFLAPYLHRAGYNVEVPRLPGHGTTSQDLLKTRAEDWIRRVLDAVLDTRSMWKKMGIVGLSMGGLLATIVASSVGVDSLVLAAPAFGVTNRWFNLVPLLRFFIRHVEKKPEDIPQFDDPDLQTLSREYWSKYWIPAIYQLWRVRKMAWKSLEKVRVPTLVIASKKDGTVPLESVVEAYDRIRSAQKRMVVLEESGHVVVDDIERERVADLIADWFQKTLRG